MELLATLDEVGISAHEEFIWLHLVDNLPPRYEFIENNLQGSKEPLTRIVLEDALWSRYIVQSGGKKGRMIPHSELFVSGSKAGRGVGRGGGRGGTNNGKLDSMGRSEGLSSQLKITCNHCQTPGHIRPSYPERKCFKCQGWSHEAVSCPSKVPTSKENEDKEKKDESAVMAVYHEPDSEVTAGTKLDKIDERITTCFMSVDIEKDVPPVGKLPSETTVEKWVAGSGCSRFMTTFADHMINDREGGGIVRIATGRAMPIEGIENLPMSAMVEAWLELLPAVRCRLKALEIYR